MDTPKPVTIVDTAKPVDVKVVEQSEPTDVNIKSSEKPIEVVNVVNPNDAPMNVNVVGGREKATYVTSKSGKQSLSPTTTDQQDLTREGQQAINLIWETTQSRVALMVIRAGIMVNGAVVVALIIAGVIYRVEISATTVSILSGALSFINMMAGMVVGFYFSRTNHTKVGGVGNTEGRER